MQAQVVRVIGGFQAYAPGAGREVVAFGESPEDAVQRLAEAVRRSFRLQALVEQSKESVP